MARYGRKPARRLRVRETPPGYAASPEPAAVYSLVMADRGRVVLPADVRERLDIHKGDTIALLVEPDGTIKIQTRAVAIRNLRGAFKHLGAPGRLASDELIADRRREAAMEERDTRALVQHARKLTK